MPSPTTSAAVHRELATSSDKLELRWAGDDASVFAREPIAAGEILIGLAHRFVTHRERHTIQIDEVRHQAFTDEIDDYVNHGCEPNVHLDCESLEVRALRPVAPGEELRHNYLTFEWEMAAPFTCGCGATSCLGEIRGYRFLEHGQQAALEPLISPYLRRMRSLVSPASDTKTGSLVAGG